MPVHNGLQSIKSNHRSSGTTLCPRTNTSNSSRAARSAAFNRANAIASALSAAAYPRRASESSRATASGIILSQPPAASEPPQHASHDPQKPNQLPSDNPPHSNPKPPSPEQN